MLGQRLKADFEEQIARAKNERRSNMSVLSGIGGSRMVGGSPRKGGESVKKSGRSTTV
jgi:hypothetical protein